MMMMMDMDTMDPATMGADTAEDIAHHVDHGRAEDADNLFLFSSKRNMRQALAATIFLRS